MSEVLQADKTFLLFSYLLPPYGNSSNAMNPKEKNE